MPLGFVFNGVVLKLPAFEQRRTQGDVRVHVKILVAKNRHNVSCRVDTEGSERACIKEEIVL